MVQGWALLPFLLGCALRFVAGSSLMDIASMLGFPPIRWSLRAVLFLVHYFLLAVAVLLWTGQDTLAEGWGPFALTVGTWIFLSHFISTFGDKDLPERQEKVQALQAGRGAAEALQGLQAAECPAHASLLEALRAFGARYIAVLDGDEERLAFVLRAIAKWKDPIGTLWGWLCRWIRALRG